MVSRRSLPVTADASATAVARSPLASPAAAARGDSGGSSGPCGRTGRPPNGSFGTAASTHRGFTANSTHHGPGFTVNRVLPGRLHPNGTAHLWQFA